MGPVNIPSQAILRSLLTRVKKIGIRLVGHAALIKQITCCERKLYPYRDRGYATSASISKPAQSPATTASASRTRSATARRVDHGVVEVWPHENMYVGSEYVLTSPTNENVTFSHSQLLLHNSASFTSWRMKDQKWKAKLFFFDAPETVWWLDLTDPDLLILRQRQRTASAVTTNTVSVSFSSWAGKVFVAQNAKMILT